MSPSSAIPNQSPSLLLIIYCHKGKDTALIEFETAAINGTIYWGISEHIGHIPHASNVNMKNNDSIEGGQ